MLDYLKIIFHIELKWDRKRLLSAGRNVGKIIILSLHKIWAPRGARLTRAAHTKICRRPHQPPSGLPRTDLGLGSGWATRLRRPGHPRAPRRRTTTSAIRGGRSTVRAPPCRRTSSLTPTSARTSSKSSTAASSYVLLHSTPPRRSSLVSVLPQ
jgi:hypothetical protein